MTFFIAPPLSVSRHKRVSCVLHLSPEYDAEYFNPTPGKNVPRSDPPNQGEKP
jgi:hypothetical protein